MIDVAEIPIRVCKSDKLDNEKLIVAFKEYIVGVPSGTGVLDLPHSEIIKLNQSYYKILNSMFPKNIVDKTQSWIVTETNSETESHNNFQEKHESKVQVSGICYLTETKHGIEFKNNFFKAETIPVLDHWYIWPSQLGYRSKEIKWAVATNTIFK